MPTVQVSRYANTVLRSTGIDADQTDYLTLEGLTARHVRGQGIKIHGKIVNGI